ncbi:hypothetical protein GH5_04240 [Leishmania sp. Ghana 2012 LV757]|uniref:hypothetical protein n=1 Tax=Leishmania sp. Ghana 2012 LV757 TaxID=2803181 RepID=UPI001B5ACA1E|nr:hypothetical protein GH5_04240 [Leishmania sp. Ghana 2012 LV757]
MITEEGFLCALPLGGNDEGLSRLSSRISACGALSPVRDASALLSYTKATEPTLHTVLSAAALYPSAYPSDAYPSSAVPASQAAPSYDPYTYDSWAAPAPPLHSAIPGARSAESDAHAARSEAERQRQILHLERELAEEQRQRLAARLSSSASSAVRVSPSASQGRASSPKGTVEGPQREASEAPFSPPLETVYNEACEELREFSMEALAPPSSPSPPSAHVQARRQKPEEGGGVGVSGPNIESCKRLQEQHTQPCASPSPSLATSAVATGDFDGLPTVSAPLHPLQTLRPCRSSPEPHVPSKEATPLPSVDEQDASVHITSNGASPSSPQRGPVPAEKRCTPRRPAPSPSPSEDDSLQGSPYKLNLVDCDVANAHEDEERLYETYKRKLARIQEALRPFGGTGVLCATASIEARQAHRRRCGLTTPALRPSAPSAPLPPPQQRPFPYLMNTFAATAPPLLSPFRSPGAFPVVRRAPSAGPSADPVVPLPRGRQLRLRWDLAHSGNIVVSSDGYVCKADATDALTLIGREYDGRLEDVLHRLVIPFYAMGNLGLTRGSLTFAFRWLSPAAMNRAPVRPGRGRRGGVAGVGKPDGGVGTQRPPALAFGFATRAFTGYGTQAPAFLYLSTGTLAQGVSTSSSAGTERPYGAPYEPGLELAARLDLEQGELEFYVEGVSMGVAFRFYPACHPAPLFPVVVFSSDMDVAELLYSL